MNNPLNDSINLRLPIKITHRALEDFLREKLIGENIKTEENGKTSNYATILDLFLYGSQNQNYDFTLAVSLKVLTSLFRNREVTLLVDVAINFDRNEQVLTVRNFNLQIENANWILENSLEAIANTLFHGKLKNKMRYDFRPIIQEQLQKLNEQLEGSMEAAEGVFISGFLNDFEVVELLPGENLLLAIVEIEGRALVEIQKIKV